MPNVDTPTDSIIDNFVAPACKGVVEILYQDDAILLINKPSGLLSLSGKNPLNWDSVHYRLVHGQQGVSTAFLQAKLPHRLDFGTSGIMVVGLTVHATQHLNKQFQQRSIQKHYTAMLDGCIAKEQGVITAAIAKDINAFPRVKICSSTGKTALTEFSVLDRRWQPDRTLVYFTPHTGRTHQLRIHSEFLGHPILGCDLYKNQQSEQMANRLLLHATDIHFVHPTTQQPFHGHSPCPF
ncbi:RluA family pseudouridine synthase [Rheinheimera baltica]|uniref:RluA family pseudouridine synthase n=1 Tax=Rheinheimera baltica TaxID=67576 RepID=UPI00273FA19C|nr:RluA family pseudouridine synthase [Rheinheimera baltica]MDP5144227.1 RluA family pseudouridine synthase [Rheinheimera baltica]